MTLFLGAIFLGVGILVKFSLFPIILESQIYSQLDLTPPKDGEDPSEGFDAFVSFDFLIMYILIINLRRCLFREAIDLRLYMA